MRTLLTIAAIVSIAAGTTAGVANAASPRDRLVEMMTRLEGPEATAKYRSSAAVQHWSMFNWLFRSMELGSDDEVIETSIEPPLDIPDVTLVPPVVTNDLAPNRIYKRQIGPGQQADVKQHGAGNTARIFQSN